MKKFRELTEEQNQIVNYYCSDEMKELKKICNPILSLKGITTTDADYQECCSRAMDTLMDSLSRYDDKSSQFKTFLTGNIKRTFYDFTRDSRRMKRCNLQTDKDGKIVKDKDNQPIVIPDVPLDAPVTEDGDDLKYSIKSNFDIDKELEEKNGTLSEEYSPKMKKYLGSLSKIQLRILNMLKDGYSREEIENILHIDSALYNDSIAAIKSYRNTQCILSLIRRK